MLLDNTSNKIVNKLFRDRKLLGIKKHLLNSYSLNLKLD